MTQEEPINGFPYNCLSRPIQSRSKLQEILTPIMGINYDISLLFTLQGCIDLKTQLRVNNTTLKNISNDAILNRNLVNRIHVILSCVTDYNRSEFSTLINLSYKKLKDKCRIVAKMNMTSKTLNVGEIRDPLIYAQSFGSPSDQNGGSYEKINSQYNKIIANLL